MDRIRLNERQLIEVAYKADASAKTVRSEIMKPGQIKSRARSRIRDVMKLIGWWPEHVQCPE